MIEKETIINTINECINDINKRKKELENEKEYGWAVYKELKSIVLEEDRQLQKELLSKLAFCLLSR